MGQFGQDLRMEREHRGVALESVTVATKISSRHLLALEQEQFSALPGGVLNKGIVRGYARACGMDEDVWIGRYLSAYYGSGQVKDDDQSWIAFAENVGKARNGDEPESDQRLRWAGVAVLTGLLIFFAWYVLCSMFYSKQIGSARACIVFRACARNSDRSAVALLVGHPLHHSRQPACLIIAGIPLHHVGTLVAR